MKRRASSWTVSRQTQTTEPLLLNCWRTPSSGRPPGRRPRLSRKRNLKTSSPLVKLRLTFNLQNALPSVRIASYPHQRPVFFFLFCTSYGVLVVDVALKTFFNTKAPNRSPAVFRSRLSAQFLRAHLHLCGGHRFVLGLHRPLLFAGPQEATGQPEGRRDIWESTQHQLPGVSFSITQQQAEDV